MLFPIELKHALQITDISFMRQNKLRFNQVHAET
jgi:hypothetical protein